LIFYDAAELCSCSGIFTLLIICTILLQATDSAQVIPNPQACSDANHYSPSLVFCQRLRHVPKQIKNFPVQNVFSLRQAKDMAFYIAEVGKLRLKVFVRTANVNGQTMCSRFLKRN